MNLLKNNIFKIVLSCFFASAFLALYLPFCIKGNLFRGWLAYSCILLSFVFSLVFVRLTAKKVLVTCALAVNCVADYFLILHLNKTNQLIGVIVFCVVQFVYAIYTFVIIKRTCLKIAMIVSRVVLSALAAILVPLLVKGGALETLSVIYITNALVTLVVFVFKFKNEWLTFVGFLLYFVCDVLIGLSNGAAKYFGITEKMLKLITAHNYAMYLYLPGIFLIALSSVWEFSKGSIPFAFKSNKTHN